VTAQSFLPALFAGGLSLGMLLIFSLLVRKNNPKANRFLCGVLLCQLHLQLLSYLQATGEIERYAWLLRSTFATTLLNVALLHFYVVSLTVPGFKLTRKDAWHFAPFAAGALWYLGRLISAPRETPVVSPTFLLERQGWLGLMLVVYIAYYLALFKEIRIYQANLQNYFSETTRVRLTWLYVLLGCSFGLWLIACTDFLLGPRITLWHIVVPAVTAQTFFLALFTLRQSVIFSTDVEWAPPDLPSKSPVFATETLVQWRVKLANYMREAKPHLNPELRLSDLASGLKLKPYQLSEILNKGEGIHFYDFINRHRIEEAQKLLIDHHYSHMSILGIAEEAGFNSKSVFNEAFKKQTGFTPSVFREQKKSD
jgi:AraC-like DNA-binding protein